MLFDHHCVNSLRILEGQEAEAPRATSSTVPHDSTLLDLAKLGEVVPQRLYSLCQTAVRDLSKLQ